MNERKSKLEIKILIKDEKNSEPALLSIDCLKIMDLSSLTQIERGNISFAVCETEVSTLKTRHEPHYRTSILQYGTYNTFEEALNYYVHKLTGEPLKGLQPSNQWLSEYNEKLKSLGLLHEEIDELKSTVNTSTSNKSSEKDKILKWLGSVSASVAAR